MYHLIFIGKINFVMKICLIGQNLTNLILALAIAERKFPVEIYLNKKQKNIKQTEL